MKQTLSLLTVIALFAASLTLSSIAAEHGESRMGEGRMGEGRMGGRMRGMMKSEDAEEMEEMPMMRQMMGRMMQPQVVAAADGGVFVMVGNMLHKYDANLQLVNKTEIEISEEDMEKMMEKMKDHHQKCRQMMQQMMDKEEEEPGDHEDHH